MEYSHAMDLGSIKFEKPSFLNLIFPFLVFQTMSVLKISIVISLLSLPCRLKNHFRDSSTVGWISILLHWWRTLSLVANGLEYRKCLFFYTRHLLSYLVQCSLFFFPSMQPDLCTSHSQVCCALPLGSMRHLHCCGALLLLFLSPGSAFSFFCWPGTRWAGLKVTDPVPSNTPLYGCCLLFLGFY